MMLLKIVAWIDDKRETGRAKRFCVESGEILKNTFYSRIRCSHKARWLES